MPLPSANWAQIRKEYTLTPKEKRPTLGQLAEKYNLKLKTVQNYARRNGWHEDANLFDLRIDEQKQLIAVRKKADQFEEIDFSILNLIEVLLQKTTQLIKKNRKEDRPLKAYEINQLSQTIKTLHSLSHDIQGDMSQALEVLMHSNIINREKAEQIILILEQGQARVKNEISNVISGNYPD
jgi:hypothetical protein